MMKKMIASMQCLFLLIGCASAVADNFDDLPLKIQEVDWDNSKSVTAYYEAELWNYRFLRNLPTAFDDSDSSFSMYYKVGENLLSYKGKKLNAGQKEQLKEIVSLRENLRQIAPWESTIWYLWDQDLPMAEETESLVFDRTTFDNEEFVPFLVPYLQADQNKAMGNIIVISGGGYSERANLAEGYIVARGYVERGYNAFVLQRRVAAYGYEDIWMDLQRAIRYLRYYGEEKGLGALDMIAACGFSGGGATVMGVVQYLYGDIQPTIYDADYTPDAVDAMSADLDAALVIYGPWAKIGTGETFTGIDTDNPNLPPFFFAVGTKDSTGAYQDTLTLANSLVGKAEQELHVFAGAIHGFAAPDPNSNTNYWMDLAHGFLKKQIGLSVRTTVYPDYVTKAQLLHFAMSQGLGDVKIDMVVGMNEDGTRMYATFNGGGYPCEIEGTVADGAVTVTYETYTGALAQYGQPIYDQLDMDAWQPVDF